MTSQIFCVQDRTGTAAQLTTDPLVNPVEVGDTGVYTGLGHTGQPVSFDFTVGAVNDTENFCITTMTPDGGPGVFINSDWPEQGIITWLTGANVVMSPNETVVTDRNVANAYCTIEFFEKYHLARGNPFPTSPDSALMQAIVNASDYLDNRYKFKGVKLFQILSNPDFDPAIAFIDPWLGSFGFAGGGGFLGGGPGTNFIGWFTPSASFQHTQWPRQGAVDNNGDSVFGVPLAVQQATSEAALRVLNGTPLQPDYDPTVVTAGAVLAGFSQEVGPIKISKTFDTKLGLSFFPDIPHVTRILRNNGLLIAGGGRTLVL